MEGRVMGEVINELRKGASGSVKWHIKNWAQDSDMLKDNAGCILPIYNGDAPPVKIRFFFVPSEDRCSDRDSRGSLYNCRIEKYLHLKVELVSGAHAPLMVNISVKDLVKTDVPEINVRLTIQKDASGRKTALVGEKFIHLCTEDYGRDYNYTTPPKPVDGKQPQELKFEVTASILHLDDTVVEASGVDNTAKEASFIRDFKLLYGAENNFADLRLEMKDNMTLSGHRFILAARSPVLRKLIEGEVKKPNFSGTTQMSDVNAKPMMAVLHWMYTGELHENVGRVMEEVVEICGKLEIPDLLKILDHKLITVCTTDNMFQLFQVAKKNGMKNAEAAISAFIKGNI